MQPARFPPNKPTIRSRVFNLIMERSFARGRYVLASGKESNYYLDMKPTMFHSEGAALLAELILQRLKDIDADYIGGMEIGAVPLTATVCALSHKSDRPILGFFVRKDVKDHGTRKRVEAVVGGLRGKNVAILEDVTTTGASAMGAIKAVQAEGANVVLVLSIVDREEGAAEFYETAGIPFDCLFKASEFMAS